MPKILQLSQTETDSRFFDGFGKAALLKGTMPIEQKKGVKTLQATTKIDNIALKKQYNR
ncbi:MAG: hypothetical protein LBN27_03880 [Prevotellaceae bacterium]|nr:hypothetical protein [Prevotellaceae bacterium]